MDDEDRFCNNCGAHAVSDDGSSFGRQQEYIGTIRKCPSCGEEIPSFTAFCPTCGHELNSVNVPPTITDYSNQLRQMDFLIANSSSRPQAGWSNWSGGIKVIWVLLNIWACGFPVIVYLIIKALGLLTPPLTPEEKSKVSLITNYSFPNDRETIVSAMLFIKEQVSLLETEKKNKSTIRWIETWKNKATQLYGLSKKLFSNERVVDEAYQDILNSEKRVKKSFVTKIVIVVVVISSLIIVPQFISRMQYQNYNSYYGFNSSDSSENSDNSSEIKYLPVPTIPENMVSNEKEGIYTYSIRNYIGKNAASIGKKYDYYLVDSYGEGKLKLVFVTENGMIVDKDDIEMRKKYRVIEQNIKPGSKLAVVHERYIDNSLISEKSSSSDEVESSNVKISSSVEYQSYDEIILYLAPIGQSYKPVITEPLPTLDWHKYHIKDYKGRNAATIGKTGYDDLNDYYGEVKVRITFSTEDGSYIDPMDKNDLKQYIVVDQDVKPNEELLIVYDKNNNGDELNCADNQSCETIELSVKKLEKSVLDKLPEFKSDND